MEATINFNTKLKEAASFGQPITEYDAASKGFKDFLKLARELMGPGQRLTLNLPPRGRRTRMRRSRCWRPPSQAQDSRRDAGDPPRWRGSRSVLRTKNRRLISPAAPLMPAPAIPSPCGGASGVSRRNQVAGRSLTRRADEVKAAARKTWASPSPRARRQRHRKSKNFTAYGSCPRACCSSPISPTRSRAIAGDFNNWTPSRMASDRDRAWPGSRRYLPAPGGAEARAVSLPPGGGWPLAVGPAQRHASPTRSANSTALWKWSKVPALWRGTPLFPDEPNGLTWPPGVGGS